jgi:tetratricopeptide (TPR) repeat protein
VTGRASLPARFRPEFLLLAALFVVLGVLRINDLFLYTPDGARYLVWGNSIAHGEGYVDDTQPEPLRFVIHAPLYPALLAPVELFFPMNVAGAKAWTLLWGLLALGLLYLWLYRLSGRAPAFAGALMLALNPGFVVYSTEVMSEAPFIAFLLAALLLAGKALDGSGLSRAEWLALLAVTSTIGLLREVGAAVTLCVAVALWKPARPRAVAVLIGAAACLGGWYLRNSVLVGAPAGSPGSNLSLAFAQAAGGTGSPALTDFTARTMSGIGAYAAHLAGMAFYPLYGAQHTLLLGAPVAVPEPLRWCAIVLFGGLIAAGAVRGARQGGAGLLTVAAGVALLTAAAVYPVRDVRFVLPVFPLAIAWIVSVVADVREPGRSEGGGPGRGRVAALFAVAAVAVVPNVPALAEIVTLNLRYLRDPIGLDASFAARDEAPRYYGRPWSSAGEWIAGHLGADAVLATPAKELAVVSGGRKVLELDPGVPQAAFERLLRANRVTHILAPARWADVRVYEPLMERSRRVTFSPVFDAAGLRLYAVGWRPFAGGKPEGPGRPTDGDDAGVTDGTGGGTAGGAASGAAGVLRSARSAIAAGRPSEALSLLDSASALPGGRADVLYESIVAAAMAGDPGRAAAAYSELSGLPQAGSYLFAAGTHLRLASEAAAIDTLPPGGERTMRTLDASRAWWELGYYRHALRLLGPVASADSSFFVGHLWNFHFNFQMGDTAAARRSLASLDRIDSSNSLVRNFHRLMVMRREVAAAEPSPRRAALRLGMAEIYRDIELFDEAFDEGGEAFREDTASAATARFLGELSASRGYPRLALPYYRDAARLDPGDAASGAIADSLARR